jgi:hypothetical protein
MALLGNLKGSSQVFQDTEFYNGVATQSLRFDGTRATTLYRDIAQAGNRKIATYAFWFKFNTVDVSQYIFSKGDGGGTQTSIAIGIFSSAFGVEIYSGDSKIADVKTTRLLRDTSSWYHLVVAIDVTQGTSSNQIKLYVNGIQETDLSASTYPGDTNLVIGDNSNHTRERIGDYQPSYLPNNATGGSASNRVNGYLCDFHHVDGQQLTPSSFGEFKNGVWIAKNYSGNHGDNGFRLEFKQTGDGQSTASSSTIGADTGVDGSGNATNNHFKDQNFETYDSNMPDSPENNWCTLNPLELDENNSGAATLEGNLKWTNVNANIGSTFGFGNQGGKYYWEYLYVSSTDSNQYQGVVLQKDGISLTNAYSTGIALYFEDGTTRVDGTSGTGFGGKINADNIIQFKLDLDNGTLQFGKNNTYIDALTLPTSVGGWRAGGIQAAGSGGTRVFVANYGQDSSFAGNKTAQGNTDENGLGDFYYAVPSGFLAVCSANLPEPTIGPDSATQADDHFNTVLWSGNSSTQAITGLGFQPDWVWGKTRSGTYGHGLYDTSRGISNVLSSESTNAEASYSSFSSFDSDGFTLGSNALLNESGKTYVAWNWKANGGTTSSNTDGSVTSTVQANTTAGFSIVTWTETTANSQTIGHGLGATPAMIISKLTDDSALDWYTFHQTLTKSNRISFNSTSTRTSSSFWNGTLDSDVFHVGYGDSYDNKSAVAYCFAEIEGYSKFGGYSGNDATDGTFVYTGFSPAFVMLRYVSGSAGGTKNWVVYDNKRSSINPNDNTIYANASDAETPDSSFDIDLLSNGFKLRNAEGTVNNAAEYLYMAFAEQPFKYANAR